MLRILIADDHPVVRHGLKQILAADRDFTVVGEAKSGDEALELARKVEWDVAILDYAMPGRSGLDLLKEIKREYPTRPVIILSMHAEDLYAAPALKAGASAYITKESIAEELTVTLRKVLKRGIYVSPSQAERLVSNLAAPAEKPLHESLSDREFRVMWLLASGKKINQIAKDMCLSPSTISTYRTRIFTKLGMKNNAQLVRYAISNRLLE